MRRPPPVTTIDFETLPIAGRPEYPPKPVGVSIKQPKDKRPKYYAWGHVTGRNNCTFDEGRRALLGVWSEGPVLFHNAKFDMDIAEEHMGCRRLPWDAVHDTMFILFLLDPHASSLALKPSAERLLGLPPEEKDAVIEWLAANKKRLIEETDIERWKDSKGKAYINSKVKLGALIAYAPGDLAGTYANGDVERTEGLFKYGWPKVCERGMLEAYDRERRLLPILLDNERVGMRVDVDSLQRDIGTYSDALATADAWLRKRLKAPSISLDNDTEVAEALSSAGIVDDDAWTLTKTGNRSVSKKTLTPDMYNDPKVASAFGYRNRLSTCLKMFMIPWERQATARPDQSISTNWNQVRQPGRGSDSSGTRTGRPSTTDPNFLNLSKSWHDKNDGYEHPKFLKSLPELPLVRRYVLPDPKGMFCHRDFNGQELRIAGHFEDGELMQAYLDNPRMDVHNFAKELIFKFSGLELHRSPVKIINFRKIYGGGASSLAEELKISVSEAKEMLRAHEKALPGFKALSEQTKAIGRSGECLVTWGGREYYCEPPAFSKKFGRNMTFEYKLLNYLIQGSAADATKEAIIRYNDHPSKRGRFMVTVYDEINSSSAPEKSERLRLLAAKHELAVMKECMEGLEFDVPMLSDAKLGPNWADAVKYED